MDILKRTVLGSASTDEGALCGRVFSFSETPVVRGQKERMSPELRIVYGKNLMLFRTHQEDSILGKYPQTMEIEKRKDGLYFKAKPLDTQFFKETRMLVKNKILQGVSAGFYALEDEFEGDTRIFRKIQLEEISLCAKPAYESGQVEARNEKPFTFYPPEFYL